VRHARAYWDVHRHRVLPAASKIAAMSGFSSKKRVVISQLGNLLFYSIACGLPVTRTILFITSARLPYRLEVSSGVYGFPALPFCSKQGQCTLNEGAH
jgi:hypothetical protein